VKEGRTFFRDHSPEGTGIHYLEEWLAKTLVVRNRYRCQKNYI